jgi:hypothetical protein
MSNATIAERRERYHRAQGRRGLVEVRVWVPAERRDDLRAYAASLRAALLVPKPKRRKGSKSI